MHNSKLTLVTLLISFSLTGCSLAPNYSRPAMPVENSWSENVPPKGGVSNLNWKTFYKDNGMQSLIELALKNNRDLRVAALNVQTAQAQYRIERSALLPAINAGASKTAEHLPGNLYSTQTSGPVTYQQYQANLATTTWEIDFFGRLRSLKESAWESYMAQEETIRATQISLISEVATAWLTLAGDRDLLILAKETYESQQKSYQLVDYGFRNGTMTEQDVMQAETSVRSAQADVQKYSRLVEMDKNAINLLLGTRAPESILQSASLNNIGYFPELNAGIPSEVITRRPDIIAAEHALKAANANIGAARAAFFPSITLTASGGTMSDSLGHLFEGGTAAWSFIPSINIPIFTGGRNKANLDVAELSKNIEVATYEKTIQQAFREVSDALVGRTTYREEARVRSLDTHASKRYFELASARFAGGVDNYLNVLVAQRTYYQSQQLLITTRQNALIQDITLYKTLGGGWQ